MAKIDHGYPNKTTILLGRRKESVTAVWTIMIPLLANEIVDLSSFFNILPSLPQILPTWIWTPNTLKQGSSIIYMKVIQRRTVKWIKLCSNTSPSLITPLLQGTVKGRVGYRSGILHSANNAKDHGLVLTLTKLYCSGFLWPRICQVLRRVLEDRAVWCSFYWGRTVHFGRNSAVRIPDR